MSAILKRYNILFVFPELWAWVFILHTYMANFIAKFRWESGFLKEVPWNTPPPPPPGTNGSKSILVTFSVKHFSLHETDFGILLVASHQLVHIKGWRRYSFLKTHFIVSLRRDEMLTWLIFHLFGNWRQFY